MMAHYQNTERLRALLKKHQSKNSPTLHWFLYFQGWNLESLPCGDGLRPASDCTWLSTGSQRLLTCIPLHWLWGANFTLFNSLIFNIFLLLHPADNKTDRKRCRIASRMNHTPPLCPHHRSSSPARPAAFSITEVASTESLSPSSSSIGE